MHGPRRVAGAIALLVAAGLAPRALAQEAYWPTHGWRRSTPEAQGMDSQTLAEAFAYVRQRRIPIHSLLIVRNGYVVLDASFWPFQDGQLHDLASVTKSVTSTLVGIAIGQNRLRLDQSVLSVFGQRPVASREGRKSDVTIEHLLTMTSGLDCHFEDGELTLSQMTRSADWIQFMLDLPMRDPPGSRYEYCSGGMHLLSGVVAQAAGSSTLDFARRELFGPLGIADVVWPTDPQGIPHGWGDLHLHPADMAKLGYLWLNGGRWENRQIVPADWLSSALRVHSHPGFSRGQEYGYGFWIYPDRQPPEFEALGRGGQRISVLPALHLIVVFTGGEFEPGDIGQFIGRAIRSEQPLPEDSAAYASLLSGIATAAGPPAPQPVPALPRLAALISGRSYVVEDNALGVRSLALGFPGGAEAALTLAFSDGRSETRPVGLDAVPRVSPGGRFGLPVAVSGRWEGDSTFVLSYDEVGNINAFELRLTFTDGAVGVDVTERSGLPGLRFRGRQR